MGTGAAAAGKVDGRRVVAFGRELGVGVRAATLVAAGATAGLDVIGGSAQANPKTVKKVRRPAKILRIIPTPGRSVVHITLYPHVESNGLAHERWVIRSAT